MQCPHLDNYIHKAVCVFYVMGRVMGENVQCVWYKNHCRVPKKIVKQMCVCFCECVLEL